MTSAYVYTSKDLIVIENIIRCQQVHRQRKYDTTKCHVAEVDYMVLFAYVNRCLIPSTQGSCIGYSTSMNAVYKGGSQVCTIIIYISQRHLRVIIISGDHTKLPPLTTSGSAFLKADLVSGSYWHLKTNPRKFSICQHSFNNHGQKEGRIVSTIEILIIAPLGDMH